MRSRVEQRRIAILDYYEGDAKILAAADKAQTGAEEYLVARMAVRILKSLQSKAGDGKPSTGSASRDSSGAAGFVIGCIGSSVTAGHDAFGHVAYPNVLENVLGPIFGEAGLNLTVRNGGIGGTNPWMASFCVENMAGNDIDVLTREWEYWHLDDGLESYQVARPGFEANTAAFELFLRNALRIPSQPAVYFLDLGHVARPRRLPKAAAMLAKHVRNPQGKLSAYRDYPVNGFTAFGKPFDHMRGNSLGQDGNRWNRNTGEVTPEDRSKGIFQGKKSRCDKGDVNDVSVCPVDFDKQDGHHHRPKDLGFDESEFPEWEKEYPEKFRNLFVNWHMGVLGHEVIAMQMSYHFSGVLIRALETLEKQDNWEDAAFLEGLEGGAAVPGLPASVSCKKKWCDKPWTCAYSTIPRYAGSGVEDWIPDWPGKGKPVVTDHHAERVDYWQLTVPEGQPVSSPEQVRAACKTKEIRASDKANWRSDDCMEQAKLASMKDQKRAIKGFPTSGPLLLQLPHSRMMQCIAIIEEPPYGWEKPMLGANWYYELRVEVNGKACLEGGGAPYSTAKGCTISLKGSAQTLVIDLKKIVGSKCKREDTLLNITVAPITTWLGEGATKAQHPCAKVDEDLKSRLGESHAHPYGRCFPGESHDINGHWKDFNEAICSTDRQEPECDGTQCDGRPPEWKGVGGPMWKHCQGVAIDRDPAKIHTYVARAIIA